MSAQELNQAGAGGHLGAHPLPIDGESAKRRLDQHGGDLLLNSGAPEPAQLMEEIVQQ